MSRRMTGVMLTVYLLMVPMCSTMPGRVDEMMMQPASLSLSVMAEPPLADGGKVAVAQ